MGFAPDPIDSLTGTSRRVRGAVGGDAADLAWTIERLTPLLVQQARYRLRGRLQRECDPEDVVAHAWQVSLPRLPDLIARGGRYTPVLLKFLSTAVLLRVNELLRGEVRRRRAEDGSVGALPATGAGVATAAIRNEHARIVQDTMRGLDAIDRDVLVLRLVEQRATAAVGELLGITAGAVRVRLHRALERLRQSLPAGVMDDLSAELDAE